MLKSKITASVLATVVGAALFSTPAVADPGGNGGSSTQPVWNTGFGDNCAVWDANGVYYLDYTCNYHDTLKTDANGTPLLSMYHDQGTLPAGGAVPSHEITSEHDFYYGDLFVQCTQRLKPTGAYSTTCYFNQQTQKVKAP